MDMLDAHFLNWHWKKRCKLDVNL